MKRYIQILILPIMLFILGCEKDEPKEEINYFVGTWRLDSGQIRYTDQLIVDIFTPGSLINNDNTYETRIFNEDGTYSYQGALKGNPTSGSGTWSSTDEILTYIEDGETELWTYSISDDDTWVCYITYPETDDPESIVRYDWVYRKNIPE